MTESSKSETQELWPASLSNYVNLLRGTFDTLQGISAVSDGQAQDGISRILNADGQPLSGVLCFDTGKKGGASAIISCTHMNELDGLAGQAAFMELWERGVRPPCGKVYLVLGGEESRIAQAFDVIEEARSYDVPLDLTALCKLRVTQDGYNYNRLSQQFRDELADGVTCFENPHEQRTADLLPILNETKGAVMGLHCYSSSGPSMFIPCIKDSDASVSDMGSLIKCEDMQKVLDTHEGLTALMSDMPANYVFMDAHSSIASRLLPIEQLESVPCIYEAGGPVLDTEVGMNAAKAVIHWQRHVMQAPEMQEAALQELPWFHETKPQRTSTEQPNITAMTDLQEVYTPASGEVHYSGLHDLANTEGITPKDDIYILLNDPEHVTSLFNGRKPDHRVIRNAIESNTELFPEIREKLLGAYEALEDNDRMPVGLSRLQSMATLLRHGSETDRQSLMVENFHRYPSGKTVAVGLFTGYEMKIDPELSGFPDNVEQSHHLKRQQEPERLITMLPGRIHVGPDFHGESLYMTHQPVALERSKKAGLAVKVIHSEPNQQRGVG